MAASSGPKDYSSFGWVSKVYPVFEKNLPRTAHNWARKKFFIPLKFRFSKREKAFLATAERRQLKLNDKQITYYSWGKGPTVIMIHGWAGKAAQFELIAQTFVKNGYNVIAADGPAHGNSTGKESSAFEFIDLIKSLRVLYPDTKAFIGHSMGGLVLMNILSENIDLKKTIIINSPTEGSYVMNSFLKVLGGSQKTAEFIIKYVKEKLGHDYNELFQPRVSDELSKTALVIHDKKDKQVGIETIEFTKQILPKATFEYTEGFGHVRILFQQEVADKCVEWVQG